MSRVEVAVEWGQLVLVSRDAALLRRACDHLTTLAIATTTSRPRRDGTIVARSVNDDLPLIQVLQLVSSLRRSGVPSVLRAGIITGALASRQGRPSSDGATRQDRTQRTIAAFTYEDGEPDDNDVDALMERYAWRAVSGQFTLPATAGPRTVLVMVEFEPDDERTWDHPQVPELQIRTPLDEVSGAGNDAAPATA